jgi:hypothetical protein
MIIMSKPMLITVKELTEIFLESIPDSLDQLARWDPNTEHEIQFKEEQLAKIALMEKASQAMYDQAIVELENIKH